MHSIILPAGRYMLTDVSSVFETLGFDRPIDHPDMQDAMLDVSTGITIPMVTGLRTAESDVMYGRIVTTPAGPVRVADVMVILHDGGEVCTSNGAQSCYWGTIDLDCDTAVSWGPGWYRIGDAERVDLMVPQETVLVGNHADCMDHLQPLTRDEIEALGLDRHPFYSGFTRWLGRIDDGLFERVRSTGLADLLAKVQRLKDLGATEIHELPSVVLRSRTSCDSPSRAAYGGTSGMRMIAATM